MNGYRRELMLAYIEEKKAVTLKELNSLFPDMSLMTIHRDLDYLEQRHDNLGRRSKTASSNC